MRTSRRFHLTVLALGLACAAYGQVDSLSLRLPKLMMHQANKSLVEQAVEGAVYLVRQEYQWKPAAGKKATRNASDYFGKAYHIGILAGRQLWIPTSLRKPWGDDPHVAAYRQTHEPLCTALKIKPVNQPEDYRAFAALTLDTTRSITHFSPGENGLAIADTLPGEGSLLIYYLEGNDNPEEAAIKSSFIPLDALVWDASGTAQIQDIQFSNRHMLGGALFSQEVQVGIIEIKLVALYIEIDKHWVLQAPFPLTTEKTKANR